jgi:hypothetical protein
MSGIAYNLSKQCTAAFISTQVELFSEHFLQAGELETLLSEALDDKDKSEMDGAIQEFVAAVKEFQSSLPKTPEWDAMLKAISSKSSFDISALYDEGGDPKARADATAALTKNIQDVAGETAALVQCIQALKDELAKSKISDGSKTIGDLANAASEGGDDAPDFPTPEEIAKAVEKSYVVPDWFNKAWETGSKAAEAESGGFFKKVMGFIGKLFGNDDSGNIVSDDVVVAAIMSSPFEEFTQINLQNVQTAIVGSTEAIGAETSEASAAAAQAQAGKDAAASSKADMKAAAQGQQVLQKNPDVAKDAIGAATGKMEPSDAAALEAGLAGKLDSLSPRQQKIVALILQLFSAGPDAATPEQVADVADQADDTVDDELNSQYSSLDKLADLGSQHYGDGGDELVKNMMSDQEFGKVFFAHHAPTGRAIHESSLTALLLEQDDGIPFEDVVAAVTKAGELTGLKPDETAVTAWATDVNDQELLKKKIAVPSEDGEDDEESPASEEEAAEEQDLAQSELETAAKEAATAEAPPAVAVAAALDNWMGGLSDTSQKSLSQKDRIGGLKSLVNTALEDAAKAIEGEVQAAIDIWRGEHEETLIKSKRFAKKNFDSLSELIPQIAAQMLKVTAESNVRLTRGMVRKSVNHYLNRTFGRDGMLVESSRWQELAGIRS